MPDFLLTGFVNGVSLGAGVVVARYFGAKDWDRMRRTIHTTVALGIAAGVALTVVGVILTPQILRWMGTPDSVLANSIAYFRMYFFGSIAWSCTTWVQASCNRSATAKARCGI